MTSPTSDRVERRSPHFTWMLALALATLIVAVAVGLLCITRGSGRWQELGFKILELSIQMLLVTVLGGVLVQAYVKWHSRASAINEFRKNSAEAVISQYSAAKKVRRLIRASCTQGLGGTKFDPWTDIPLSTYDTHMFSINDTQLALELIRRRLKLLGPKSSGAYHLSEQAEKMEEYLGDIIGEYEQERQRQRELKRESIPLNELIRLRAFIAGKPKDNPLSDFKTFERPFIELLKLLETEGIWVAI